MTTNPLKLVLITFLLVVFTQEKPWRGIAPLRSTRQDVERILGPSKDACNCIYKTPTEVVTVGYARDNCTTNPGGWNVPQDTVVTINVSFNSPPKVSDLKIDTVKYKRTKDLHTPATYYSNEKEGVMYQVSEDGMVPLVVYGPTSDDLKLRCDQSQSTSHLQPAFDEYGQITFNNEKARLDNYAAQLNYLSDSVGYIVVYPTSERSLSKSLRRARRARSYLVRVRGVKPSHISVIEGGCREAFTIELYILPRTAPAPRPEPSLCRR
jgi:hypothetical protein